MEDAKRLSIAEALRREGLGPNLIDVAEILWAVASLEPGRRAVITVSDLGHRLRKDARCVRRWLADLAAVGMIRIESREKRWGAYTFTMADPRVRLRSHVERAIDEQQALFEQPSPAGEYTVSFADHAPQVGRSADMVSALDAQRGHGVRATGPEPARSADMASALRRERNGAVIELNETEVAEYRSVVAEARAAIVDSARDVRRVCAGAKAKRLGGNTSLEGSGKRQRLGLEPSNLPTRETGPPPLAFAAALANIPAAADTATQRATVAAELAAALGVGDALWPAFWANVAALVGEPGPDGRVQFTRAKVDRIIARARAKQPHDAARRAQYASKALRGEAKHLGLEWPRAP